MSEQLVVIARLMPQPGKQDELLDALGTIVTPTRAEPGCLEYRLHRRDDGDGVVVIETWRDQQALDAHFQSPHMQAVLPALSKLLAGPLDLEKLRIHS